VSVSSLSRRTVERDDDPRGGDGRHDGLRKQGRMHADLLDLRSDGRRYAEPSFALLMVRFRPISHAALDSVETFNIKRLIEMCTDSAVSFAVRGIALC
jgi:hypothetical protein